MKTVIETELFKLNNLCIGTIVKRPSLHIKSPYVADVNLGQTGQILSHCPSLGCAGLCEKGTNVYLMPIATTNKNRELKCSHVLHLSVCPNGTLVGTNPKMAETLVARALELNCLTKLQNIKSYNRETSICGSRFDFTGYDSNGTPFILEVKNVPVAIDGVAYFPVGPKKKNISPRAIKHLNTLAALSHPNNIVIRRLLCYVIQRPDVTRFEPSPTDIFYRAAYENAINRGVEIITMVVEWNSDGTAHFITDAL